MTERTGLVHLKKILLLPIFAVFISILVFLPPDAHAVSYELQVGDANGACEAIGGSWSSSTNTCNFSATLRLNNGDSLTVDSGVILANSGSIDNDGTITNAGTINNNSGGTITLDDATYTGEGDLITPGGIIDNKGELNNQGYIDNENGISSSNYGSITNDGTLLNAGAITNYGGGTITNNSDGTFKNDPGGSITNYGTVTNNGILTQYFAILYNQKGGTVNNNGKFEDTSAGDIVDNGIFNNNKSGIINDKMLSGHINDGAEILIGFDVLSCSCPTTGTFNNWGTINSASGARIDNYDVMVNNNGATIDNNGTIYNRSGATINNYGIITNNSSGTIDNNGTIKDYCNSTFTNNGTYTGNPVINACVTTLSLFPKSGLDGITSYATGKNFIPKHAVTITFDATTVATATTNSAGAFYNMPFTVPPSASLGPHTISATDGTNTASATFTVKTSTLSVSPKSGAAGTVSNATGHAFIPSHGITITFDGATVATTTATKEGAFYNMPFTVPVSAALGPHTVTATDGTNTASATFTVK